MAVPILEQLVADRQQQRRAGGEKAADAHSSQSNGNDIEGADNHHAHIYENSADGNELNTGEPLGTDARDHEEVGAARDERGRGLFYSDDDNKWHDHPDVDSGGDHDVAQDARAMRGVSENGRSDTHLRVTVPPTTQQCPGQSDIRSIPADHAETVAIRSEAGMQDTSGTTWASESDESVDGLTFRTPDLRMPTLGEAAVGV